jgi:hypothetical protein
LAQLLTARIRGETDLDNLRLYRPRRKQALWRIYKRSETKRRAAPTDFSILVEDYITPFIEDGSTRTRGLATSGAVVTDSGGISYPAKYYARMFEPTFTEYDYRGLHLCSFVLKELDRVAP